MFHHLLRYHSINCKNGLSAVPGQTMICTLYRTFSPNLTIFHLSEPHCKKKSTLISDGNTVVVKVALPLTSFVFVTIVPSAASVVPFFLLGTRYAQPKPVSVETCSSNPVQILIQYTEIINVKTCVCELCL